MVQWICDTASASLWDWSKIDKAAVQVTDQLFHMRDGTQQLNLYDPAHGDALQSHAVVELDGSSTQLIIDTTDTHSWSSVENTFNISNKLVAQQYFARDGSVMFGLGDPTTGQLLATTHGSSGAGVVLRFLGSGTQMIQTEFGPTGTLAHVTYTDQNGLGHDVTAGSVRLSLSLIEVAAFTTQQNEDAAKIAVVQAICTTALASIPADEAPPAWGLGLIAGACAAAGYYASTHNPVPDNASHHHSRDYPGYGTDKQFNDLFGPQQWSAAYPGGPGLGMGQFNP